MNEKKTNKQLIQAKPIENILDFPNIKKNFSSLMLSEKINPKTYTLVKYEQKKSELFRKSALTRVIIGTSFATFVGFLVSNTIYLSKIRSKKYLTNMTKGAFGLSLVFYTINEFVTAAFNYNNIYTNFVITNCLSAIVSQKLLFKVLYNRNVNFYKAFYLSQRYTIIFLSFNMTIEFVLKLLSYGKVNKFIDVLDYSEELIDEKGNVNYSLLNDFKLYLLEKEKNYKLVFNSNPSILMFNSKRKQEFYEEFKSIAKYDKTDARKAYFDFILFYHYMSKTNPMLKNKNHNI